MAEVLALSLEAALFLSGFSLLSAVRGVRERSFRWLKSARNGSLASALFHLLAFSLLCAAFLRSDFTLREVAEHSSRGLLSFYKVTAVWGGQAGSLLLWATILSLYTAVVSLHLFSRAPIFFGGALVILEAIDLFFLSLLIYLSPPFALLPFPPSDGAGLNPLLQNPWMAIHPPMLYIGYVGLAVPYAFCMAGLLTGDGESWLYYVRKYTLFAWLFLGTGILFGAQWAYLELGWGGYWGWDPVENASLMPWLLTTAFLHSVMVTEYRGMLKVWNVVLIAFAFALSIFGTFLTRSGILSSVHSFAESSLGPYFFAFFLLALLFSSGVLLFRHRELASKDRGVHFLSKESFFLFNNLVLAALAFTVFWGTVFPLISEALLSQKIAVASPYFNAVTIPFFLILLFLTGLGPLLGWRKTGKRQLKKILLFPFSLGLFSGFLALLLGVRHSLALGAFSLCGFVLAAHIHEFSSAIRFRRKGRRESGALAFLHLFLRNPRRYGGYVVHLGILLIFLGATGEGALKKSERVSLRPHQSVTFAGFQLTLEKVLEYHEGEKDVQEALLVASRGGERKRLRPQKLFFEKFEQPTTEVALLSRLQGDLYVVLEEITALGKVRLVLTYNPLVILIWWGGVLIFFGGGICFLPVGRKKASGSLTVQSERIS